VSVRIHSLFSAIIAAATIGLCQSATAEPLKAPGATHLSNPSTTAMNGWKMTPVGLAGEAKGDTSHVASAMSRLDLRKLTMADFGDVEQSR
jgi:hypothetical protein